MARKALLPIFFTFVAKKITFFSSEDEDNLGPSPSKHKRLKTKSQLDQIAAKKLSPNRSDLDDVDAFGNVASATSDISDLDEIAKTDDELAKMSDDEVILSKKVAENSPKPIASDLPDNDVSMSKDKDAKKDDGISNSENTPKKLPKVSEVSESEVKKSPKKVDSESPKKVYSESPKKVDKSPKKVEKSPQKGEQVKDGENELDNIRAKVLLTSSSEDEAEAVGQKADNKNGRKFGKQVTTSKTYFPFTAAAATVTSQTFSSLALVMFHQKLFRHLACLVTL